MENLLPIPEGSVEIQTGLWLYEYNLTVGGRVYLRRELYSSEGYCFYDNEDTILDEEGDVIPPEDLLPEQRRYAQYMSLAIGLSSWTHDQLNARFISVPVDPSYEIANKGSNHETI